MKIIVFLIAIVLTFQVMVPCALSAFSVPPAFDVTASSNLAGATDAVYMFHFENADKSTRVAGLSLTIPAGYSINPVYITQKSGIPIITGKAGELYGISGDIAVTTTNTPGRYAATVASLFRAEFVLTEPTSTVPGKFEVPVPNVPGVGNAVYMDVSTVPGFFINPSTPGDYTWGPSLVNPSIGSGVVSVPRSGLTQTVTIIGTSVTAQPTTTATFSIATAVTSQSPTTAVATQSSATTATSRTAATVQTTVTSSETASSPLPYEASLSSTGLLTQAILIGAIVAVVIAVAAALLVVKRNRTELETLKSELQSKIINLEEKLGASVPRGEADELRAKIVELEKKLAANDEKKPS